MQIESIVVGPFDTNCYLVWDKGDNSGVIIDPGDQDDRIVEQIKKSGFNPLAIIITHGHADHISAMASLKKKYDIPVYIGKGDAPMLLSAKANFSTFFGHEIVCPAADFLLNDEDVIKFGSLEFTVLETPGHSRGGICLLIGNRLFCGDTLFSGSIGRTDFDEGNHQQLIDSIEKKILTLPDDIVCYPGHGPSTTVGTERLHNPFFSGSRLA